MPCLERPRCQCTAFSGVGKRDVVDHNAIRAFASVAIPVLLVPMT